MDVIGKEVLKGTVEKHIRTLSSTDDAAQSTESNEDELTIEEQRCLEENLQEKKQKMLKVQAKRRLERAKTREEIRRKHNLKECENDKKLVEEKSSGFSMFSTDSDEEENSVQQAANAFLSKLKDTWGQLKESFSDT